MKEDPVESEVPLTPISNERHDENSLAHLNATNITNVEIEPTVEETKNN